MKLNLEQIKSITQGADRVLSDNGKIKFFRFTEEQQSFYEYNPDFYKKTFATAGVRLEFATSSRSLSLKVDVTPSSSRTYFTHDIYINGEIRYSLGADLNSSTDKHLSLEGSYALGAGKKTVCIYFPWSVCSELISLEIDNGASLSPVKRKRKILLFGDSITHGYDAANPSCSYASLLTDALEAEGLNKAIGGDIFHTEAGHLADNYIPDIITVAYGTNDWSRGDRQRLIEHSRGFFEGLSALYPTAKIFALTPIWRGDADKSTGVGAFEEIAKIIEDSVKNLPNVHVINCTDFVPHNPQMFSPDVLHPNDLGFSHYAESVIDTIKKEL